MRSKAKVPSSNNRDSFCINQGFSGDVKLPTPVVQVNRHSLEARPNNLVLSEPVGISHPSTSCFFPLCGSLGGVCCIVDSSNGELVDGVSPDVYSFNWFCESKGNSLLWLVYR